ncbi:MAG: class I SAM-dependent methyltransferase [Alphaproteobacteria bacterium]|nr:class I SAM-dependent methyltransferase [Alphaproteobacteria bacterium]
MAEERAADIWGLAGEAYNEISRGSADAAEHCLDRLRPGPGETILDVATGTGFSARRLASRGATVVGIDISPAIIEAAQKLSSRDGNEIEFRVANAEDLPFEDGQFDAVVSIFGVIYAGRAQAAAAELARVCRKGGRLALSVWNAHSVPAQVFELLQSYMPPVSPVPPSPFEWGEVPRIEELLGESFELDYESGISYHNLPDGEAVWALYLKGYGPLKWLAQVLEKPKLAELERRFVDFHNQFRTNLGVRVPRDYLVAIGTRR